MLDVIKNKLSVSSYVITHYTKKKKKAMSRPLMKGIEGGSSELCHYNAFDRNSVAKRNKTVSSMSVSVACVRLRNERDNKRRERKK